MRQVKPVKSLTLEHRALYLCQAAAQPLLAAASDDGDITVFRPGTDATVRLRSDWRKINAISLHPSEPVLAITGSEPGKLRVLRLDGTAVFETTPPRFDDAGASWMKPAFDGCLFTDDGKFLWCSAPISKHQIEVQLRETREWSVVAKAVVEDPFGGSSTSFHPGAGGDVTTLWLAAGQDGQQVCWVTTGADGCRCILEPCLRNTVPPAFSPGGNEFLVVGDDCALHRYQYPPREPIGTCESPEGESDPFAEWARYLDDSRAMAKTNNGRVFLIDVPTMHVLDEIALEGHEPRPIDHYYPTLRGDKQLCTDISYFDCLGDMLVFVCRSDRGSDLKGWRDSVICVPIKSALQKHFKAARRWCNQVSLVYAGVS